MCWIWLSAVLGEITSRCAIWVNVIIEVTQYTGLFNAAGVPCTAQPVRTEGSRVPASLQLVGPLHGEELLLATASRVEAAMAG
jgi:Asp-tRNA(Asn)/Glu-tRNA(Gln) amidotransferase A subunit family amidase